MLGRLWDWGDSGDVAQHRAAARELAGLKCAERWVIALLLDHTTIVPAQELADWFGGRAPFGEANPGPASRVHPNRFLLVTAALLEGIRKGASSELLWAVTSKLSVGEVGEYSYEERRSLFTWVRVSAGTKPIRDLARNVLRRELQEDHGYSVVGWRQAILRRTDRPTDAPASRAAP